MTRNVVWVGRDVVNEYAAAFGTRGIHLSFMPSELLRNAPEAVASFDVVIVSSGDADTDIRLCRRLRLVYHAVLLLLTSSSTEAHLLEAYAAGVDECIIEPLPPHLLAAKVHAWLRRLDLVRRRRGQGHGSDANGQP